MYRILRIVLLINLLGFNLGFPVQNQLDGSEILNTRAARDMEYPFAVIIQHENNEGQISKFCGGAIIKRNWILTAAHCFDNFGTEQTFHINAGIVDASDTHPNSELKRVKKVVLHPNYKVGELHDDIALLLLEESLSLSSYVRPIYLPYGNKPPHSSGDLVGWSATDTQQKESSPHLVVVDDMPVSDPTACSDIFPQFNSQTMLCVGANIPKSVCMGDSAGSYIQYEGPFQKPTMLGVISFGTSECNERPIVLTNVKVYIPFILHTMRTNQ